MKKRVAVLQPHYLPYAGTIAMADIADVFVVYDDVQFEHQSWQHRNRIRNQSSPMWLTVPIIRKEGQLINEVVVDSSKNWRTKHWKSICQNYSNTPFFNHYKDGFEKIYKLQWNRLLDLNETLFVEMAIRLGIKMPEIVRSSWYETAGAKTDRLIPILKAIGATSFIEGMAGKDYLDVKKLNENGIQVFWFDYQHPVYPQNGKEFISHLSALDVLFNTGEKAVEYIRQGVNLVEAKC